MPWSIVNISLAFACIYIHIAADFHKQNKYTIIHRRPYPTQIIPAPTNYLLQQSLIIAEQPDGRILLFPSKESYECVFVIRTITLF